ncbi:MAG: PepSY domain-containing protein [Eubacterium sp.]
MTKKKKMIILIVSIVVAVAAIGAGSVAYGYDVVKKNSIGIDKAIVIAMEDAGVTEEDAIITKAKMSFEDGRFVYDVEFLANGLEFDYEIKAADGTVIKKDKDIDETGKTSQPAVTQTAQTTTAAQETTAQANNEQSNTNNNNANNETAQSGEISLEEAKSIALKKAGLNADSVTFTKAYTDYDDGRKHYYIEFYDSSYKYEYDISTSGDVISYDKESRNNNSANTQTTTQPSNSKYIGIDKAKSVAISNAGKSESDVKFIKAKLENDDGIWKYEIEFISGTTEYDYEIDALSGKILDYDRDSIFD